MFFAKNFFLAFLLCSISTSAQVCLKNEPIGTPFNVDELGGLWFFQSVWFLEPKSSNLNQENALFGNLFQNLPEFKCFSDVFLREEEFKFFVHNRGIVNGNQIDEDKVYIFKENGDGVADIYLTGDLEKPYGFMVVIDSQFNRPTGYRIEYYCSKIGGTFLIISTIEQFPSKEDSEKQDEIAKKFIREILGLTDEEFVRNEINQKDC